MQEIIDLGPGCREIYCCRDEFPALHAYDLDVCGLSELSRHYIVQRKLPLHEILVGIKGEGYFRLPGLQGKIAPKEALIIPAGTPFRYELKRSPYWQIGWFLLKPDRLWKTFPNVADKRATPHPEIFSQLLKQLHIERYETGTQVPRLRQLLCDQLCLYLQRLLQTDAPSITGPYQRIRELFLEVEANPANRWNINDMGKLTNCSRSHLHRLCKEYFGCGPMEKVNRIRMQHAAVLLRISSLPIKVIAARVGFDNPYNFSTAFKRIMGSAPTQVRNAG